MTITSAITGIVSLNNWLDPKPGLKRIIDNIVVKISTIIFVIIFLKYLSLKYKIMLSINLSMIIYCYTLSCINYLNNSLIWIPWHFGMHIISAISMTTIMYVYNLEHHFKDTMIDL
jgi:hypothetical protein